MQSIENNPLAAVKLVKETLSKLRQQHNQVKVEIADLAAQRKALLEQAIPLNDVKQVLFEYIDARAQIFLDNGQWLKNLNQFIYPNRNPYTPMQNDPKPRPLSFEDAQAMRRGAPGTTIFPVMHPKLVIPDIGSADATDSPFLFFFGEQLKAKISDYFENQTLRHEECDINKVGVCMAERQLQIERIDQQLSKLTAQRSDLERQINELKIIEG